MGTWRTRTKIAASPEQVLELLTDPRACSRWSPVEFELEDMDGERLTAGTQARVAGRLAGQRVAFDVEVFEADDARLALRATGPVELDVLYEAEPAGACSEVTASVEVRSRGGLRGKLLSSATDAVLAAGTMRAALERIASEAQGEPSALAA